MLKGIFPRSITDFYGQEYWEITLNKKLGKIGQQVFDKHLFWAILTDLIFKKFGKNQSSMEKTINLKFNYTNHISTIKNCKKKLIFFW